MSGGVFLLVFLLAAVALAVWAQARLVSVAPRDLRAALLHLAASVIVCQILAPAVSSVLTDAGGSTLRTISLVCITLPALVYALLSVMWLIGALQNQLRNGLLR